MWERMCRVSDVFWEKALPHRLQANGISQLCDHRCNWYTFLEARFLLQRGHLNGLLGFPDGMGGGLREAGIEEEGEGDVVEEPFTPIPLVHELLTASDMPGERAAAAAAAAGAEGWP